MTSRPRLFASSLFFADPYDAHRKAELEAKLAHPIEKPFRPANYPRKGGGTVTPGARRG